MVYLNAVTCTVFVVLMQNTSYENLPYSQIHLRKKIELSFIRKFCTSTNFEQSQKGTWKCFFCNCLPESKVLTLKQFPCGDVPILVKPVTLMQYSVNGFNPVIRVFLTVVCLLNSLSWPFSL